jgi:hypothetical protein
MESVVAKSLVLALSLAAVVVPAWAQSDKTAANNADVEAMKRANAFRPPQSDFGNFSATKNPGQVFNVPPPASPDQDAAWKKYQETQKDWTLMTPAEILNIPTPERILGIADPDEKLSPEERYLKRLDLAEHSQAQNMATNSASPIRPEFNNNIDGNPFTRERENVFRPGEMRSGTNGPANRNHMNSVWNSGTFQNPTREIEAERQSQANQLWETPFTQEPQTLKPDPVEQAAMDRFRTLLEPPKPLEAPTLDQPVVARPVDPNMEVLPAYNPAGNSFTPMQPVADRPFGLMPLPGPTTRHIEATSAQPAWAPKLPPWMNKNVPGQTPTVQSLQNQQYLPQRVF